MLTDNQNKLIEDIRKEFSKMNTPTKAVGGGLINKGLIDAKFAESDRLRQEYKCITEATTKAIRELIDKDLDRLNRDLITMGMIAQRYNNNEFYVRIDSIEDKDQTKNPYPEIRFCYIKQDKYDALPDCLGYTYYIGLHSITWSDYRFKTIDELCAHPRFIRALEDKYRLITNQNQNKCK